ncbi:ROK family protein [Actinomadura alba]|uniref:ROK family protein n=2 Tax=Actinomadura alba TaxID=406431 RepID=A0ABR7LIY6_9ACTN|nr:ROK family protein [Actinomadura alba]
MRTRAQLTHDLDLARGTATVLVADLIGSRLVREEPTVQRTRGRPTRVPGPHPDGPVALAVDFREDSWTVAMAELGGRLTTRETRPHRPGPPEAVLGELADALRAHVRALGQRVAGVGIAMPGPVRGDRLLDVPHLGWRDVEVTALLAASRIAAAPLPVLLDNDATLAGLAEARRGALRGVAVGLHLHVDFDVGGTLILDGRPLRGAHGTGGEFGHMPLTGASGVCACGATGCWSLGVGANALVRLTGGEVTPGQGREEAQRIIAEAMAGDDRAAAALTSTARALGQGVSALVNAHDPQVVTLSGVGADLRTHAEEAVREAYLHGLMMFRRDRPPELVSSALGSEGILVGASEMVFDAFLTPRGLHAWQQAVSPLAGSVAEHRRPTG